MRVLRKNDFSGLVGSNEEVEGCTQQQQECTNKERITFVKKDSSNMIG